MWANRLPVNPQISTVQVNEVEPKTIKLHLQSQECLLHTPVHLAPVVVQQVAAVKIPMNQDRGSPIWPWLSMMMNLLTTHTRSFLLRMPSLFLSFQDRAWKGSIYLPSTSRGHCISRNLLPRVRSGYTGASPWDFPLDCQGHMASKLYSGLAVYSSYIGIILTGIVYPQQEDSTIKINQYSYFDIIGTVPTPTNHGIWGCLHYLPLVSNVFLA